MFEGTVAGLGVRRQSQLAGTYRYQVEIAVQSRSRACRCKQHSGPAAEDRSLVATNASAVGVDGPRRHQLCQTEAVADLRHRRPSVDQIIRIGMDTSKHVFQLHGINAAEVPILRKKLRRKAMVAFFPASTVSAWLGLRTRRIARFSRASTKLWC